MSENHNSFIEDFYEKLDTFLTEKLSDDDREKVVAWADTKIRQSFSNGIEVGKKRAYKDAKKKKAPKQKSPNEADDLLG